MNCACDAGVRHQEGRGRGAAVAHPSHGWPPTWPQANEDGASCTRAPIPATPFAGSGPVPCASLLGQEGAHTDPEPKIGLADESPF